MDEPYMKIIEEPKNLYRFRYSSEKGPHGGLPGEHSCTGSKTYPAVKVVNYKGPVQIEVSLVTNEPEPRPHIYQLYGSSQCDQGGKCVVRTGEAENMQHVFRNLCILHIPQRQAVARLIKEAGRGGGAAQGGVEDKKAAEVEAKMTAKNIADCVRLCFTATILDPRYQMQLAPVYSKPIFDLKAASGLLKIHRVDRTHGSVSGNQEVFMLCEKVQKTDVRVRFFELDSRGRVVWEDFGRFSAHDVHKQVAIVFKTPPYRRRSIDREHSVQVQLVSDKYQNASEPITFLYVPDEEDEDDIRNKSHKKILDIPGLDFSLSSPLSEPEEGDPGAGGAMPDSRTDGGPLGDSAASGPGCTGHGGGLTDSGPGGGHGSYSGGGRADSGRGSLVGSDPETDAPAVGESSGAVGAVVADTLDLSLGAGGAETDAAPPTTNVSMSHMEFRRNDYS